MPDNEDTYNEIDFLIIAGVAVAFVLTVTIIVVIVLLQQNKFRHAKKLVELEQEKKQALLQTQLEIQEQTFQNISQELHDNIGQALSFIKLNINTVDIDKQQEAKEKLVESKNLLTQVIQDLRDMSKTLNTDFISEIGLANAIEQQLNMLQKSGVYQTELSVNETTDKYQLQRELVVFRIEQELLNNIVKHADATCIKIDMNYLPGKLMITITDNGKGFDTTIETKGLGFRNMLNRMTLINGFITINSKPGEGTTAIIDLPKQNELPDGKL